MTTITTDGVTIASDSQDTIEDTARMYGSKLFRLRDGRVAGITGEWGRCQKMMNFLNGKLALLEDAISEYSEDMDSALLIAAPGKCWIMRDYECTPYEVDLPQALGSGEQVALGAMRAGATPAEAVRIASQVDINTGGDVHVLKLEYQE